MAVPTGWIAHYVFQTDDGEVRTSTLRMEATTRREAMDIAGRSAPAEDFVVQIHAESDDQFLGRVRSSVSHAIDPAPFDPKKFEQQDEEADQLIESLLRQLRPS